jgi:hypothetical protein
VSQSEPFFTPFSLLAALEALSLPPSNSAKISRGCPCGARLGATGTGSLTSKAPAPEARAPVPIACCVASNCAIARLERSPSLRFASRSKSIVARRTKQSKALLPKSPLCLLLRCGSRLTQSKPARQCGSTPGLRGASGLGAQKGSASCTPYELKGLQIRGSRS